MTFAPFARDRISLHSGRIGEADAARQERTAEEILERLDRLPGVILADEVGMGKTFVALAVAVLVALHKPKAGPIVVMVPPSLQKKWPKDWEVFREKCIRDPQGKNLRIGEAKTGIEFLRLLDDPPNRRSHIIFLTHGALHRSVSDGWVKLALIKRAFRKRSSLAAERRNFYRFAGSLLRMDRRIEKKAPGLLGKLLDKRYEDWLRVIHQAHPDFKEEIKDDPVPRHLVEVLRKMKGSELDDLVESLRALPIRSSANIDERLKEARGAISTAMKTLWAMALRRAKFRSPLLIMDEAHHLKNPATRLASLFVDEEAAADSELFDTAGPLGGKFERMLFLTATPFQLGHAELVQVLSRFEGIAWNLPNHPVFSRDAYREELRRLADLLDGAQAAALRLDGVWGRLPRELLLDEGGRERTSDEWWESLGPTRNEGSLSKVVEQIRFTGEAMRKAEAALAPWVLRHLKTPWLPEAESVPRRKLFPGASILEGGSPQSGLPIKETILLPFLLAGRAQKLLAASSRGRALFAEGLASSFEAYLDTRRNRDARDEDGDISDAVDERTLGWYLSHLDKALPKSNATRRMAHPKILATADRVVDLWLRGEKVLVFCHYRATGRALRQHISQSLRKEIMRRARAKLPGMADNRLVARLDAIGRRFLESDSALRREISRAIERVVSPYEQLTSEQRQLIVEVVRRFLRTHSFLVRYFPLERRAGARVFVDALDQPDESGLSLRQKISEFCRFLAERCIDAEREEYLEALVRIQTGTMAGQDVRAAFDRAEGVSGRDAVLLPNIRLANGEVPLDARRRLLLAFNTPLFPEVLIASSVLAEGVDLHLNCRYVIHHDLCWNPSTLEQRSGRADRLGSKAEVVKKPIHLYLPYVAATQDEKMYRVVCDRERWFQIVMGEKYEVDEMTTDCRAERIPLPESLQRELSLRLSPP